MPNPSAAPSPGEPSWLYCPLELSPERWERAGRRLLAKMIGEFAHEGILAPEPDVNRRGDAVTAGPPSEDTTDTTRVGASDPGGGDAPVAAGLVDGGRPYLLRLDAGGVLAFRARRGAYDSWQVDPSSLTLTGTTSSTRPTRPTGDSEETGIPEETRIPGRSANPRRSGDHRGHGRSRTIATPTPLHRPPRLPHTRPRHARTRRRHPRPCHPRTDHHPCR